MRNDQRKFPRRKLDLAARITWPRPMACVIADISATGAQLPLDNVRLLPDEFILALNVGPHAKVQSGVAATKSSRRQISGER